MPWKRNPMRCERICALSRFVMETLGNTAHTAANQWLERTLDDSANRRLALAECFLAVDAIMNLYLDVAGGLVVNPAIVTRNLDAELPFLASENLMMEAVKAGGDRQDLHERIRVHSHEAAAEIKAGGDNTMRRRLAEDPAFSALSSRLDDLLDGKHFVGRAPEQVLEFIEAEVDPLLERHADLLGAKGEVTV
jgi:adenylosuccinate lyase